MKILMAFLDVIFYLSILNPINSSLPPNFKLLKSVQEAESTRTVISTPTKTNQITKADEAKPYFFLSDADGKIIIMDAVSYDVILTFQLPEISSSVLAIVGDTLYNIDTLNGTILSTELGKIMANSNEITWAHAGSFPNDTKWIRNSAAVNGSIIYFVTYSGILYEYNTESQTVVKRGQIEPNNNYWASLIVTNNALYIQKYNFFYSYDGKGFSAITTPDDRYHCGLFERRNTVCRVGGSSAANHNSVYCYDPSNHSWSTVHDLFEASLYPGIATAGVVAPKTYIFGGEYYDSNIKYWGDSVQKFDQEANIWSYILTPLTKGQRYIQAIKFDF